MASPTFSEIDQFLSEVEIVREEIRRKFFLSHEVLRVRESVLLSELDELVYSYRGEGVRGQIQDLNQMKDALKSSVQRNENLLTVAESLAPLDARIRDLEVGLETARRRMRRVELEWDGELQERMNQLGGVRVIGQLDYMKIETPLLTVCMCIPNKTSEPAVLCSPCSVSIDLQTNYVYLCDNGNNRVQVFDSFFNFLFQFSDMMNGPWGICISENLVYVTQCGGNCLTVYSIEGILLDSFGMNVNKELEFDRPKGVALSAVKNLIYICDNRNNRIQCLNLDLTFNSFILKILAPRDIELTQNEIVVLNGGYQCISTFNFSHQFVRQMIRCGEGTFLTEPCCFCLDNNNNILITDISSHCVSVFTIRGEFIHKFGKKGNDRGGFVRPTGIVQNSDYKIIVVSCNTYNCIQLF